MIFVTVGTHYLQFDRLLGYIIKLMDARAIHEKVIVQSGTSTLCVPHSMARAYYPYNQFITFIKQSRIVICAAGPATIYQCMLYGKKPIVVPRSTVYKEHVSDHQLPFAEELVRLNKVYLATTYEILKSCIKSRHMHKTRSAHTANTNLLARKIDSHLKSIGLL